MGLLSGISKFLFGDPTKDIRRGEDAALAQQQKGLDYQMKLDAPLIANRNQAMGLQSDYYMGGPEGQQQFYDQAMQSPGYENYLQQGEERILRNAAATGGLRGGSVNPALALNQFNVAQGLVDQRLQGLNQFANPNLNTANITNTYGNMGNIQQQSAIAQGQAKQSMGGMGLGALMGGLSMGMSSGMFGSSASPVGMSAPGGNINDYTGSAYNNWLGG